MNKRFVTECLVDKCDRVCSNAKTGYCRGHQYQYSHGQEFHALKNSGDHWRGQPLRWKGVECSVVGCDRGAHTRGWCGKHYQKWKRHGDPTGTRKRVPAKWYTDGYGYVAKRVTLEDGTVRRIWQHRVVMEESLDRELLAHENVHHINGIRDDNNIENLELWSTHQPSGQRVEDKILWAKEFLMEYGYSITPRP